MKLLTKIKEIHREERGSITTTSPQISGQQVEISGQAVTVSGPVQVSGTPVQISGQSVALVSGTPVGLSGLYVYQAPSTQSGQQVQVPIPTSVSGNIFTVLASGTQFPPSAGLRHLIRMMQSSVMWVGGASTVNSGVGFMLAGDPTTNPLASMDVNIDNLNRLYAISQTSGHKITYLSLNY